MGTVLFCLLSVGFVIGVACCTVGLYLVVLRLRGVSKLGDVPGIGEIGTLQSGASLFSVGAYCFYYALSTYVPLQNGAVLQQRVNTLLIETSRDLRKEFSASANAHPASANTEDYARVTFLISFMQRIDDNNGHAAYYAGEVRRRLGKPHESHQFFYRYLEEQESRHPRYRDGGTGAEVCYARPRGFCAQRSGWIHHVLANDLYKKAATTEDRVERRVLLDSAAKHVELSLGDFPGFVQDIPTKVLQVRVAEERKGLGDPQ
jgi:hypothetical protein